MREFQHLDPVWGERSDFVIGIGLEEPGESEQLWARRLDDREFELCCIPFFAYGLALGDVVETDAEFNVVRVRRRSGRLVYRLWLEGFEGAPEALLEEIRERGALVERYSESLVALDASTGELAREIVDVFERLEDAGLVWEAGD